MEKQLFMQPYQPEVDRMLRRAGTSRPRSRNNRRLLRRLLQCQKGVPDPQHGHGSCS
ncbi:hypothetical protein [Zymomonas mobilis]|uniref:hypothetical protein n=1 Tax=Zymomonas mobilis TaxID=542 RepID=UPI00208DBC30|nr:hypothetical protein [Zymomonas mobilis]MDX5949391.1 hypothetical protein [Zymomonas mobilis subsp. pomaceae]